MPSHSNKDQGKYFSIWSFSNKNCFSPTELYWSLPSNLTRTLKCEYNLLLGWRDISKGITNVLDTYFILFSVLLQCLANCVLLFLHVSYWVSHVSSSIATFCGELPQRRCICIDRPLLWLETREWPVVLRSLFAFMCDNSNDIRSGANQVGFVLHIIGPNVCLPKMADRRSVLTWQITCAEWKVRFTGGK